MEMFPTILDLFLKSGGEFSKLKENSDWLDESNKLKDDLAKTLSDEQRKLLNSIQWRMEMHWEEACFELCEKGIYFGLKLGMDIQHFIENAE